MSLRRGLHTFGRFWWDFIIGDTPELALGVAVIVLGGWLLAKSSAALAVGLVPLGVILLLLGSLRRGARAG
ncbi:MAG: hypothetical protein M0027_00835 [Candidatus Dormibacteraeota bacterium]|nr:hypothetical protein [Candidatus Dormibacteraeota bacterium]